MKFGTETARVWLDQLGKIVGCGQTRAPRGEPTREILFQSTMIPMDYSILTVADRRLNYRFMAAEAYSILTGSNFAQPLMKHIKNYDRFTHDGRHIQWAYGPKVVDQIWYCAETLLKDPLSRQAVINIWRENPRWNDPPCTLSLQFLLRDGRIHTVATMRSSDLWLGWPYDIFCFSMITAYLGLLMHMDGDCQLGTLQLNAGSMHVYEKHVAPAKELILEQRAYKPMRICDWLLPESLIDDLECLSGASDFQPTSPSFIDILNLVHHDPEPTTIV